MAPSAPIIAFALAVGVCDRSGNSFQLHKSFRSKHAWSLCSPPACLAAPSRRRPRPAATVLAATQPQEDVGNGADRNHSKSFQYVLGQTAIDTEGTGADAEAEALRQQVFANEKGFRESSAFNPVRAREAREAEEARALAAQWGSTPERAKEIMKKTQPDKDLSFQELERIAEGLSMTDEQQRAFMLKASMKKLSSTTALPKRAPRDRVKEAIDERVFASEKGFMQNSSAFKSRMKLGSGVQFDSNGFPAVDEDDPVILAAKKRTKEEQKFEGVTFPSLPDCPRCSTPTIEEELSQFGMCSQCKAQEISSKAYNGPQTPSKYTYDNGDAPFSSSWRSPSPGIIKGGDSPATGGTATQVNRGEASSAPITPVAATAYLSSASSSRKRKVGELPLPGPVDNTTGVATPLPPASSSTGADGRDELAGGAGVPLQKGESKSGNSRSSGGKGSDNLGHSSAPSLAPKIATLPSTNDRAKTAMEVASASTGVERAEYEVSRKAAAAPTVGRAPAEGKLSSATIVRNLTNVSPGLRDGGSISRVRARTADRASTSDSGEAITVASNANTIGTEPKIEARMAAAKKGRNQGKRGEGGGSGSGGGGGGDDDISSSTRGADSAEIAVRKLSLEVSELRTQLTINRAALARIENMSGRPVAAPVGRASGAGDYAIRKLTRDVAEVRKELSGVLDKVGDAAVNPPRGRGGDTEVIQNLNLEVAELRSQLESARKETALTRSALRRLQDDIDGLRKSVARR